MTSPQVLPAQPKLEISASCLVVSFTPPNDATNAALHPQDEGGAKRFYCATARTFLPAGESGSMLSLPPGAGRPWKVLIEDGLTEGKVSATICYRAANAFAYGLESARSNTLELARPVAKCAPRVTPIAKDQVTLSIALPAFSAKASIKVEDGDTIYRAERRPQHTSYLALASNVTFVKETDGIGAGGLGIVRLFVSNDCAMVEPDSVHNSKSSGTVESAKCSSAIESQGERTNVAC